MVVAVVCIAVVRIAQETLKNGKNTIIILIEVSIWRTQ